MRLTLCVRIPGHKGETTMIKSYSELCLIPTFEERYEYLRLCKPDVIGTFGFDRYMNRVLYASLSWKRIRDQVIVRYDGCDLAIPDRRIYGRVTIHHINPITVEDIERGAACVLDPNNLVCTSHDTHNAIHYGDASLLITMPPERRKGDTHQWKSITTR